MKFWSRTVPHPNCPVCHRPQWDVSGTGRHPDPRCDPEGLPWWELPEWAEWLAAIERETPVVPPESDAGGLNPAGASEET